MDTDRMNRIAEKIRNGYLKEMWMEWKWVAGHFRGHWKSISFFLMSGILSILLSLGSSVAGKYLIDAVTGYHSESIVGCTVLTVGLALASVLITNGISLIKVRIRTSVENEIQEKIYADILQSEWLSISSLRNGDILNRLNYDSSAMASGILDLVPTAVTDAVAFLGSLGIMLYYDPMMALIALISAPVATVISYGVVRKIRYYNREMMKAASEKMSFAEDSVSNIQTVKALGIIGYFRQNMRTQLDKVRDITLKNSRFTVLCQNILSVVGVIATYSCYIWGVYRLWGGFITYGTMTLFIQLASRVRSGFSSLVSIAPEFVSIATRASRIMELENFPKEKDAGQEEAEDGSSVDELFLSDVSFAYTEELPVLEHISFHVSKGEIVALIGPSGEGKTTISRLLLGLINPKEGSGYVRISGGGIRELGAGTRGLFSYVPQGNTLFAGTVADNVRMGRLDATEEEIRDALEQADAWDFVEKLEGGLSYLIGEHGKGLSEGQAQRISIARAIIRNAPIILMDEATSALDPWTEKRVLNNIMKADADKIIIVTAHRQSVMALCDRKYRVSAGSVQEVDDIML